MYINRYAWTAGVPLWGPEVVQHRGARSMGYARKSSLQACSVCDRVTQAGSSHRGGRDLPVKDVVPEAVGAKDDDVSAHDAHRRELAVLRPVRRRQVAHLVGEPKLVLLG